MKKFAFVALLTICVAAIAATSGNSQQAGISAAYFTNVADTTPMHHSTIHKTMMHKKTTMKMKKPMKDSTKM